MIYGEKLALRALELSRKIRAHLRKYTRSEADAEDVHQQHLMRLLEYGRTDRAPIRNIDSFVHKAAKNEALGNIRRQAAWPLESWGAQAENVADPRATPEEALDWSQQAKIVVRAAIQLPKRLRTVLWLSKREGLSYREIGVRMGITEKEVKADIARAVYRMKQRLSAAA